MNQKLQTSITAWIFLLLVWIASIGTAYFLGHSNGTVPQAVPAAQATSAAPERGAPTMAALREAAILDPPAMELLEPPPSPTREPLPVSNGVNNPTAPEPLVTPLSPAELDRYLRSALASRDGLYRDLVFSQVLYQLTRENAPAVASALMSGTRPPRETLCRFISAWARLDGRAAMAYARGPARDAYSSDGRYASVQAAVKSWAESAPEACLAYLNDHGMADDYLSAYLSGSSAFDPAMFQSLIAGLDDPKSRRAAVWAMADGMENASVGMLDWAERVINMDNPEPSFVRQVLECVQKMEYDGLSSWVDRNADSAWVSADLFFAAARSGGTADPLAALAWMNRRSSDPRVTEKVFDAWIEGWTKGDAPGLAAWLLDHVDDPRVEHSHLEQSMSQWAKADPEAAARWVERNKGAEIVTEDTAAMVVQQWIFKAPYATRSWIDSLPRDLQGGPAYSAASRWPQGQLDDFATWLDQAGPDAQFDSARRELANRYIDTDPEFALSLTGTITEPKLRERTMVKVAEKVMGSNPEAVQAWLPGSGLSEQAQAQFPYPCPS